MGLTTERKVFLGLLAIAGASIVIDQAILSPGSAGAATLSAEQIDAMPEQPLLASITEPITRSITQILNDRLSKKVESSDLSDQMTSIQQMFAPVIEPEPVVVSSSATLDQSTSTIQSQPKQAQQTASLPVLSGTMPARSGESGAILNGFLYRVGESTPSGYRLLEVEPRRVLVELNEREYWIAMPAISD